VRGAAVPLLAAAATPARDSVSAVRAASAQRPPRADAVTAYAGFAAARVREHAYGLGPRRYSVLPLGQVTPDGGSAGAQLAAIDPAGRLSALVQAAAGDPRTWRGGSVRAAWRGLPVTITGELIAVRQALAASAPNAGGVLPAGLTDAVDYRAATIVASGSRWLVPPARPVPPGEPARVPGDTTRDGRRRPVVGPRGAGAEMRAGARLGASIGRGECGRGERPRPSRSASCRSAWAPHGARWPQAPRWAPTPRPAGPPARRGRARSRLRASLRDRRGARSSSTRRSRRSTPTLPSTSGPLVGGPTPALFDAAVLSQRLAVPALPTGFRGGRRAAVARLAYGGAAVTPYVSAVGAGDGRLGWARLAGVERRFDGPFAPFARLPRVRLVAGVARIFDEPLRHTTRGYLSATFTP
jgi:hypothetical protein